MKLYSLLISFILIIGFAGQVIYAAEGSVYEQYTTDNTGDVFADVWWKGQTFIPSTTHIITTVRLKLVKEGEPSGDVVVSIRATDDEGLPTGQDLASGRLPCSLIEQGWSYQWYEFDLGAGCVLEANTRYAICWRAPDSDTDNRLYFSINISGTYPKGWVVGSGNAGSSWGSMGNKEWDAVFEEWGIGEAIEEPLIFVTPPITDNRILPNSILSPELISNQIFVDGSPSEYRPATFTIQTPTRISELMLNVSDLVGQSGTIPSSAVDIKTVKCWYQDSGTLMAPTGGKILVPELLLKDDELVKVEGEENYLKMTSGEYTWISYPTNDTWYVKPTPSDFPVRDSNTLQPVDIPANTNKQFWVTLKIPSNTVAGTYTGTIELRTPADIIGEVQLNLEVLPITLALPKLEYSLYYLGTVNSAYPDGTISHRFKSEQQMRAEFIDMVEHGLNNVALGCRWDIQDPTDVFFLGTLLSIKNDVGMTNRPLYYAWLATGNPSDPAELDALRQRTQNVIDFARAYGVTDVYAYGFDEATNRDLVLSYRPAFEAVHDVGGKILAAGYKNERAQHFDLVGDLVDAFNCCNSPDATEAARWHSIGAKIYCYNNPQVGEERPETYRRNFGLLLWQNDYDGAINHAYQAGQVNIWNDFDSSDYRDHVFAYPTIDGVIDTVQWEGWREGVNDIRYLTTLLEAIEKSKMKGVDTSTAEAWLAELKVSNLSTKNLDTIRSEIIDHILSLTRSSTTNASPELSPIGNKTVVAGELLQFTISAMDPDGDNLTYSASNFPEGASFDPQMRIFSWTPADAGTYSNIHFTVSDGNLTDSEDITINVNSVSSPPAPPLPPSGGGRGPIPPPTPQPTVAAGYTYISQDIIRADGTLTTDVTGKSEDGRCVLIIEEGTQVLTKDTEALDHITIIEMEEPPPPPDDSNIIGLVYDFGPDGATFGPAITLTLTYEAPLIPEGVAEENLVVAFWDEEAEAWIVLEDCVVDPVKNTITAPISHFTAFAVLGHEAVPPDTVAVPPDAGAVLPDAGAMPPATFELTSLSISPAKVKTGEEVMISVMVTNTGGQAGNYEVIIKMDDEVLAVGNIIDLAGGAKQEVTFSTAKKDAGTYTVNANGIIGTFVVEEEPVTEIYVFSVIPSYNSQTNRLTFARVNCEVSNLYEPVTDVALTLKVSLDGELLEEVSLLQSCQLKQDGIIASQEYIPHQGWESGNYSFGAELYVDGKLRAITMEEGLEVTTPLSVPVYSWATLGVIVGIALILIVVTVSVILFRRRHLLRHSPHGLIENTTEPKEEAEYTKDNNEVTAHIDLLGKLSEEDTKNVIAEEIRKAIKELSEEQRKAIRCVVEEYKKMIRDTVEEVVNTSR